VKILFSQVWPKDKRITVEVLCQNEVGIGFWRAVGFTDYSLTLEIYPDLRTTNAKAGDPASDSGCETTPSNSR
jgi:ribosomal protein S18 acetylase RimI-like enzyme